MKTAHRNSAHAKRRFQRDPHAWAHVIAANSEQPIENANAIMLEIRLAFEKLKLGTGDQEQFDRLAAAINVGLIRSEQIDPLAVETMVRGVEAMFSCSAIHERHGQFGFTGPDLVGIADALDLYDGILRLSTPKQMMDALEIAADRMRAQV